MDILLPKIKGMYRDCLYGSDGCSLYDSGWKENKIVEPCHVLLARLMKNDVGGITSMKVGKGSEGNSDWYPIPLSIDDNDLKYLTPGTSDESNIPTNYVQATITMMPGIPTPLSPEGTYPLQEFGLFGSAGGEEYMIDYVEHPRIEKDSTMTLIRVIRLTF